jgi:hypothetical protein
MTSSSHLIDRPLSGVLLRTVLLALAVALFSSTTDFAWSQERAGSDTSAGARWQPVRIVDDPATGAHWLLERDTAHPGTPGRMTRTAAAGQAIASAGAAALLAVVEPPAIRAGDHIVVEEETAKVSARLEGVSLAAARAGDMLKARLVLGGRVVSVRALAPGRATLVTAPGGGK